MILLSKMLAPERIIDLISSKKEAALKELVHVIGTAPEVADRKEFYREIIEREKVMSTGIGIGLAVPHVKTNSVSNFVMAIGRKPEGIQFDSLDGQPVQLIVMIGASAKQKDDFLKVLAQVVLLFKNTRFRKKIMDVKKSEQVLELIMEHEK